MPAPVSYGGLGLKGAGLGLMGLGGPQQPQNFTPSVAMPKTALPYVAHLYTNTWQFKRTLGGARLVAGQSVGALVSKPMLKMTINGSYQPVTLELDAEQPPANQVTDPGFEASDLLADVQVNWTLTTPGEWALLSTATDMRTGRRAIKCTRTNLGPNNWNSAKSAAFKVLAGETYSLSLWIKQNGGAKQGHGKINWLDSTGAVISSTFTAATDGVLPWTLKTGSGTAPANAVSANLELLAGWWDGLTGTNSQVWFDDARVVLGTDKSDPALNGDLVQLTEQGDSVGTVLFTGIIEEISDDLDGEGSGSHQLVLTPLVAELSDTYINRQYVVLTDVAQMLRDAVALTAHLRVAPWSVGDTGVKALYNFNTTTALDVANIAKQIAGLNFWWGVDATGLVWLQPASPSSPPTITVKRGADYKRRKWTRNIANLKNLVKALGGYPGYGTPSGPVTLPITSTYSNAASQKKYGLRMFDPPMVFSTVNDQATLDLLVNTVALAFDREQNVLEITLPAFAQRLNLCRPGGLTVRIWEPVLDPFPQPGTRRAPGYAGPFVCQDIEVSGIEQKLIVGDVPVTGLKDIQFILDRIIQAAAMAALEKPPFFAAATIGAGWPQIGA